MIATARQRVVHVYTTFTVLNLFIALILSSVQSVRAETTRSRRTEAGVAHDERVQLLQRIELLNEKVRRLRDSIRTG